MGEEQEERGWCHAVEPRRLTKACRPVTLELLPELGGETGDPAEGEVVRDGDALLFAEGGDVDLLTLEIDRVARIDRELLGNLRIEISDLGPDWSERCKVDVGIGEQLVGAALLPVTIDGKAALDGFVGCEGETLEQSFAVGERFDFAAKDAARSGPTQPRRDRAA